MVVILFIKIIFVQFFCVIFLSLLDLFCVYQVSTIFVFYCAHIWVKYSFVLPIFLKKGEKIVFPFLLFASIFMHCSLKKVFLSLLASLQNSAFSWNTFPFFLCFQLLFFIQLFVKPPQITTLSSCFPHLPTPPSGMILFSASYTILWASINSSLGTLFTTSNPLNLFITSTEYSQGI